MSPVAVELELDPPESMPDSEPSAGRATRLSARVLQLRFRYRVVDMMVVIMVTRTPSVAPDTFRPVGLGRLGRFGRAGFRLPGALALGALKLNRLFRRLPRLDRSMNGPLTPRRGRAGGPNGPLPFRGRGPPAQQGPWPFRRFRGARRVDRLNGNRRAGRVPPLVRLFRRFRVRAGAGLQVLHLGVGWHSGAAVEARLVVGVVGEVGEEEIIASLFPVEVQLGTGLAVVALAVVRAGRRLVVGVVGEIGVRRLPELSVPLVLIELLFINGPPGLVPLVLVALPGALPLCGARLMFRGPNLLVTVIFPFKPPLCSPGGHLGVRLPLSSARHSTSKGSQLEGPSNADRKLTCNYCRAPRILWS